MSNTAGQVIKSKNVNFEGQYQLDLGQPQSSGQPSTPSITSSTQVRIVENGSDYALVEVSCSCGTKTLVKCTYSQPAV